VTGLNNFEQIMSEAPLFQLRGIQVFRTEEFYTEVARLPWSAFPKHYQLNEWLITNYMVRENCMSFNSIE
jgi:hypothetical protein